MHRNKTDNPAKTPLIFLTARTLNATPTGSTSTAVLRFDTIETSETTGGNTTTSKAGFSPATTPAEGTIITISEPGIYLAMLALVLAGAGSVDAGISRNASGTITANPAIGTGGVQKVGRATLAAGDEATIAISTRIIVTPRDAAAGVPVRAHATDGSAGAPTTLTAADCCFELIRVADIYT